MSDDYTETPSIHYKRGFKYQLHLNAVFKTPFKPEVAVCTDYVCMSVDGYMLIRKGYAWDGPSGPVIDTPSAMRASLAHDALYQLIRLEFLPASCKDEADDYFKRLCKLDGMLPWRYRLHNLGLEWFGRDATRPSAEPCVMVAP